MTARLAASSAVAVLVLLTVTRVSADVPPQQALTLMRSLRAEGCAGRAAIRAPLHVSALLNNAAAQWSHGTPLQAAIERSGYREDQSAGLHVAGDLQALRTALSQQLCGSLTDASISDTGILQRGADIWIVVATPFAAPALTATADAAGEVLRLVNAARAQPQHCGRSSYGAASPLQLNALLSRAAQAHADDMLRYDYFEHAGHDGSTPAQRVADTGYGYRVVGENIAFGPESPGEAVRGWMASPGHCQNIMDPSFGELGVAFSVTHSGKPRIYWVQEFAAPR